MTRFWVVGGIYTDTDFRTVAGDSREELIGPFDAYDDAVREWRRRAWATVDNCHARYRIVPDESDWHPTAQDPHS